VRWIVLAALWFAAFLGGAFVVGAGAIPFEVKEGFLWVRVQVAQASEPLNFILDSGAEVSTVNVGAAEQLGLKGGRRVTVAGVGHKGGGRWPVRLNARVGNMPVPEEFLVTDLCEVQESCQCRVDGLLGADFFWRKVVEIDFRANTVRLLESAPEDSQAQRVPIRFRRKMMQVPIGIGLEALCEASWNTYWQSSKLVVNQ
jgi:hypothetical protein